LAELVSLKYKDEPFKIHTYLVKINCNCVRAEHYHKKKQEWMTPIFGKTLLKLTDIQTKRQKEYLLDFDDKNQKLFISHLIGHIQ